jgi:hypothetical protein
MDDARDGVRVLSNDKRVTAPETVYGCAEGERL